MEKGGINFSGYGGNSIRFEPENEKTLQSIDRTLKRIEVILQSKNQSVVLDGQESSEQRAEES